MRYDETGTDSFLRPQKINITKIPLPKNDPAPDNPWYFYDV